MLNIDKLKEVLRKADELEAEARQLYDLLIKAEQRLPADMPTMPMDLRSLLRHLQRTANVYDTLQQPYTPPAPANLALKAAASEVAARRCGGHFPKDK